MTGRYLYHITLTTGHVAKQPRSRMDSPAFPRIAALLRAALAGGTPEILPGHNLRAEAHGHNLITSVWSGGGLMLTTGVALQSRSAARLWRHLHNTADPRMGALATRVDEPAPAPWIADRIEIGLAQAMQAAAGVADTTGVTDWSGALSALTGWAWMEYTR